MPSVFLKNKFLLIPLIQRFAAYRLERSTQGFGNAAPSSGFGNVKETARFGIQEDNSFPLCIEHGHSARQRIQDLAQRNPHSLGFRDARLQGSIAVLKLPSQFGHFIVQPPV
jgi:hypothetical protein